MPTTRLTIALLAATLSTIPAMLSAQTAAKAATPADVGVHALRDQWRSVTRYITRAAEQATDAEYAYRPIGTVRTFGQLVAHVAGAQYAMCDAALGTKSRDEGDVEKAATTKAAIVQALKESTAYCEKAYAQSGAAAATTTDLYGDKVPRMQALALNAVHNGEHYGNIITYMRMQGKVPPSSQSGGQ